MSSTNTPVEPEAILPLEEAIAEVTRELGVRQRCFPRWTAEGKLTAFEANERLGRLTAAKLWLEKMLDTQFAIAAQ